MLELARGICGGLEFAHSENVVHRDLKPSNVFLTGDGAAKVGDFGVALALDRSRLTQDEGSTPIGTAAYMPPEQAIGGEVTPRSDLYSLGAMLYELICGRPPFVSDDPWVVITQHLETPPVAPSWHTDVCPPDLEALVLRLLEKSPDDRPESASEVLGILERIDAGQRGGQPGGANPLERIARGVFVGREQELEQLRAAFDHAHSGAGAVVMVVGEPGIGKTRIVQELETYARMRGGEMLWGRAHEAAGAPAYWPWVQVIRSHVAAAGSDELRSQLGTAAPEVARIVPEVRGAYRRWVHAIRSYLATSGPEELRSQLAAGASEVARIVPEVRERFPDLPEPEPARDSETAQFRLFDAITTLLKNASAETPLVAVLDDLHRVERPTLLLLEHLSREIGSARLLVVGTCRDVEPQSPLEEVLAELSRGGRLQTVDLRGLSEEDVAGYIREAAGVEPSSQLVDAVYRETGGNPFFVSEVVLLMAQDGTLESGEVSVPPDVRATVGRRLSALSEGCNELLTIAAVVGRELTHELLVMLSDADDAGVLGLEEEALAAHVIEQGDAAGQYRFSHALVEETLLGELSTTRRVRLHGRVAEALEELPGQRAAAYAAALAWHFVESATLSHGHAERATRYSRIAAEQAEAQFAWEQAVRHYEGCLALVSESDDGLGEDEAELLVALAGCQRNAAGAAASSRSLTRAIDLYRQRRDGRAMARTVLELDVQGAVEASDQSLSELAGEALALLGRSDSHLEAGLLALRARDHFDETAEQFVERAAQLAREHGYADVEA